MGKWSTYRRRGGGPIPITPPPPPQILVSYTGPATTEWNLAGGYVWRLFGQGLPVGAHLTSMDILLRRAGAGTGTVRACVWSRDASYDPLALLAESDALNVSSLSPTLAVTSFPGFNFTGPAVDLLFFGVHLSNPADSSIVYVGGTVAGGWLNEVSLNGVNWVTDGNIKRSVYAAWGYPA